MDVLRLTPQQYRERIRRAESELKTLRGGLRRLEERCTHKWEVQYTPHHKAAYTIPGDPVGSMGVDWRGPLDVPAKTIMKWTRTCSVCGMVQTTEQWGVWKQIHRSGGVAEEGAYMAEAALAALITGSKLLLDVLLCTLYIQRELSDETLKPASHGAVLLGDGA